ncbi:MAG: S26 family signal peptidase [Paraclostridium sp.]
MKTFKINGSSMMPYFKHGQVIKLSKCNNFKVGDIIVYNTENIKVWHRIVKFKCNQSYALTKGDNCLHFDSFKIELNENSEYYVLRHRGQEIIARTSNVYGKIFDVYINIFHKNVLLSKFCHSKLGDFFIKFLEKLQNINLKLLLYLNLLDINIEDSYE